MYNIILFCCRRRVCSFTPEKIYVQNKTTITTVIPFVIAITIFIWEKATQKFIALLFSLFLSFYFFCAKIQQIK